MEVKVVGRHLSLHNDQALHAEQEAGKLAKFFDGLNDVTVTIEPERDRLKAEIICAVSGGGTLVAVERGGSVNEAIDLAVDNMSNQVKRYKAKLHDLRHNRHAGEPPPEPPADKTEPDSE